MIARYVLSVPLLLLSQSSGSIIDCQATEKCFNDTITCEANEDCHVLCKGESACALATIQCPSAPFQCSISCVDSFSCSDTTIYAQDASSLSIDGDGSHALVGSDIYCPSTAASANCNVSSRDWDDVRFYSANSYTDSIHIECSSASACWTSGNRPLIHYGDATYSKTCAVTVSSNSYLCVPLSPDVQAEGETHTESTTASPIHDSSRSRANAVGGSGGLDVDNALMLVMVGLLAGVLLTICCGLLCCYHWHNKSDEPFQIKRMASRQINRQRPRKLSPALQRLSPAFNASAVELSPHKLSAPNKSASSSRSPSPSPGASAIRNQLQIMSPCSTPMADFMIDDDGIVVTAGAYQNAENKSDEESTMERSPSSTVVNACYRIHVEEVVESNMRLSPCSLRGRDVAGAECYSVHSASNSMQPLSFGDAVYRVTMGGDEVTAGVGVGEFEVGSGGSSTEYEGVSPA